MWNLFLYFCRSCFRQGQAEQILLFWALYTILQCEKMRKFLSPICWKQPFCPYPGHHEHHEEHSQETPGHAVERITKTVKRPGVLLHEEEHTVRRNEHVERTHRRHESSSRIAYEQGLGKNTAWKRSWLTYGAGVVGESNWNSVHRFFSR